MKAQRQSERDSAAAERDALQAGAWPQRARRVLGLGTAQPPGAQRTALMRSLRWRAEVEKLKKHNEALQHRKTKLADRTQARTDSARLCSLLSPAPTSPQGAQQQQAAVVRNSAALQHSIEVRAAWLVLRHRDVLAHASDALLTPGAA